MAYLTAAQVSQILVDKSLENPGSAAVGQTAGDILQEKTTAPRSILMVVNTSTLNQTISLGFGRDAVIGSGVTLYAGQGWIESPSEGFRPSNLRISAVASAAAGAVAFYERMEPAGGN